MIITNPQKPGLFLIQSIESLESMGSQAMIDEQIERFQRLKMQDQSPDFIDCVDECILFLSNYLSLFQEIPATDQVQKNRKQIIEKLLSQVQYKAQSPSVRYELSHVSLEDNHFEIEGKTLSLDQLISLEKWGISYGAKDAIQDQKLRESLDWEAQKKICRQLIKKINQIPHILKKSKGQLFQQRVNVEIQGLKFEALILQLLQFTAGVKGKESSLEQDLLESTDLLIERKNPFQKYQLQLSISPLEATYLKKQEGNRRMKCPIAQKRILTPYSMALVLLQSQTNQKHQHLLKSLQLNAKTPQGIAYLIKTAFDQAIQKANAHPLGASMNISIALQALIMDCLFE